MKSSSEGADKMAIGLSAVCIVHCLALTTTLALLPNLTALHHHDEAFHLWMMVVVFPTSLYALAKGYQHHRRLRAALLGGAGLTLLFMDVLFGEHLGTLCEMILATSGSSLIAFGHLWNYRLCRQPLKAIYPGSNHKNCEIPTYATTDRTGIAADAGS